MSYTNNELAEQAAMKDMIKMIIGTSKREFGQPVLDHIKEALEDNVKMAESLEQYHLAEVFNEANKELNNEFDMELV